MRYTVVLFGSDPISDQASQLTPSNDGAPVADCTGSSATESLDDLREANRRAIESFRNELRAFLKAARTKLRIIDLEIDEIRSVADFAALWSKLKDENPGYIILSIQCLAPPPAEPKTAIAILVCQDQGGSAWAYTHKRDDGASSADMQLPGIWDRQTSSDAWHSAAARLSRQFEWDVPCSVSSILYLPETLR